MKNFFKKTPFIIAELSGNHNGSLDKAKKIISAAKRIGVDAIKFQTIDPDKITFNSNNKIFKINDKKSIWSGSKMHDLYKKSAMDFKNQEILFKYAKKIGILAFSTPFHLKAVDFLEKQKVPFYKIASLENNYFPLIKRIIKTKKHIIISTGASKQKDIDEIVKYLKKHKFKNFSLLKCTSSYPASLKELDLNSIEVMKKRYKCRVGFSDHTDDILASIVAVSKGATIIEKHIKLKDSDKTIDSKFSLSIKNFSKMIQALNKVRLCFGSSKIRINKGEKFANKRKRSLFAIKDITKNEKFTHQNIDCLRPGDGLESKFFEKIINKKSKKFIKAGTPISFSLIS